MHQMIPTYLLPIFGNDIFLAKHIPKIGFGGIPNLGPFLPPPNHTLYTSSVVGLAPLHGWDAEEQSPNLALLLPWYFCLFFDFVFFLLHAFSIAGLSLWLCLISLCVSCYVCRFLWFDFSFFYAVPADDTFCCYLFLFIVFLHISFHSYPFILDICTLLK